MKSFALLSFLALGGTFASIQNFWGEEDLGDHKASLPDSLVDYSRWKSEGLYVFRAETPHHSQNSEAANDDQLSASYSEMFAFRKVYDANMKRVRVDGYPVSSPKEYAESAEFLRNIENFDKKKGKKLHSRVDEAFVMIGENDMLYLITEENENVVVGDESNVRCRVYPMKFKPCNYWKHAKFDGLTFERNRLCHKYENVLPKRKCGHGCSYELDYSSMYIDAFSHQPTEMFFEGKMKRGHGKGEPSEVKFWSTAMIKKFSFMMNQKEENDLFSMPKTVKDICVQHHPDEMSAHMKSVLSVAGVEV